MYHSFGPTGPTIDSEYAVRQKEKLRPDNPENNWFRVRDMQEHHDYYVEKYQKAVKDGKQLTPKEMSDYELAVLREQQGFVKSLSSDIKDDNDSTQSFIKTCQQHHDYYVQMYKDATKQGKTLDEKDMHEYKLAMWREAQGLVNPLV